MTSTGSTSVGPLLLSLGLLLAFGCAETVSPDAGPRRDGATGMDSGSVVDSGPAVCTPECGAGRDCCGGECTNLQNDPRNCGECANPCGADTYCTGGECIARPCTTTCDGGETCCGGSCCGAGEICCDPQGPISTGPVCTTPDERGTCPVGCAPLCACASPDTLITTPDGDRPIATLEVGDLVYSADGDAVAVVPLIQVRENPVENHFVVQVTLESGASLEISGRHPTADGRWFSDLRAGDRLDGRLIERVETIPYRHPATYDILPDSDTGTYFAEGVLIGSTLERDAR